MKFYRSKITILVFYGLISLLSSCKKESGISSEGKTIKIPKLNSLKETNNDFSEAVDSTFFVRLETRKECLIGSISKIKVINDHIHILDTYKFKAFFELVLQNLVIN